jgi:hypothetical protein
MAAQSPPKPAVACPNCQSINDEDEFPIDGGDFEIVDPA